MMDADLFSGMPGELDDRNALRIAATSSSAA
jgi:hypothetical protein